jgi:hypothetical protein
MKEFHEKWEEEDIDEYVKAYGVLVLFEQEAFGNDAKIVIYGSYILELHKRELELLIIEKFAGQHLTEAMCWKINDFAEKWYNKEILFKKARVVNKQGK